MLNKNEIKNLMKIGIGVDDHKKLKGDIIMKIGYRA
jgi:hypothetical protein